MKKIIVDKHTYRIDFSLYRDFSPDLALFTDEELEKHFISFGYRENRIHNIETFLQKYPSMSFFGMFHRYVLYWLRSFITHRVYRDVLWAILNPFQCIRKHVWHAMPCWYDVPLFLHNPIRLLTRCFGLKKFLHTHPNQGSIQASLDMQFSDRKHIRFENSVQPKVSIIIPVYNKWQFTYQCLRSLKRNTRGYSYEVIIVDNASSDETKMLLEQIPNITYLRNNTNLGFSRACNQGALRARGNYLVFLNNDTTPLFGWLPVLIRTLDSSPKIGITGSKLLYPNTTVQHAGVLFDEDGYSYHPYRGILFSNDNRVNTQKVFLAMTGACLAIRKQLFKELSGFDEVYSNGYEDIDLCLRMNLLGYVAVYCPSSCVYHYESMTEGRFHHNKENTIAFDAKWKGKHIFELGKQLDRIDSVQRAIAMLESTPLSLLERKKSDAPLVTVITVTFNILQGSRDQLFRQCLKSVHDQTYANIEHIIIDGASTDGSLDMIQGYADRGWIRYISEPDAGIYEAMNKGILLAKGKYVAFLNSDDYYHNEEALALSVDALEKNNADFSYAPALYLDSENNPVVHHPHCNPDISNVFFFMPCCHQSMLFKRDVMIHESLFDTTFKFAGDYDFLIRVCLKNYTSVFVPSSLVTFRLGGISAVDENHEKIKQEVFRSFFTNYNTLVPITEQESREIYRTDASGIPLRLAQQLKARTSYFKPYAHCKNEII